MGDDDADHAAAMEALMGAQFTSLEDAGALESENADAGGDDDGDSLEKYLQDQINQLGGGASDSAAANGKPNLPKKPPKMAVKMPPPTPAQPASTEIPKPGIGAVVETQGLSKDELNGLQGKVARHQGDRVVVELPQPHGEKALRPVNMKVIVPGQDPPEPAPKRARAEPAPLPNGPAATKLPGLYEPAITYWEKMNGQSKILIVGEGNFSWAWNLCHILGTGENMVCTDAVMNSQVAPTRDHYLLPLIEAGATINMRLDATRLGKQVLVRRCGQYFDYVCWNFPHTTTPNKAPHSQEEHRQLLTRFLQQAELVLQKGGKASITVKDGYPYNEWRIASLQPGGKMRYAGCQAFLPEMWPIYAHVTTRAGAGVGGSSQIARVFPAHSYVFECQG